MNANLWNSASLHSRDGASNTREVEHVPSARTRLRELREAHRLPVSTRNASRSSWDIYVNEPAAPVQLTRSRERDRDNSILRLEPTNSHERTQTGSNETASSTEAAAFFASGLSNERDRRPSSGLLRQRRLRLSGLDDISMSISRDRDHVSPGMDGGERNSSSSWHVPAMPFEESSPVDLEFSDLLYPSSSQRPHSAAIRNPREQDNTLPWTEVGDRRPSAGDDHPWNASPANDINLIRYPVRNMRAFEATQPRTSSRPPTLPPIRFLDESPANEINDFSDFWNDREGEERLQHNRPPMSRREALGRSMSASNTNIEPLQREGPPTMHRALLLHSMRNRALGNTRDGINQTREDASYQRSSNGLRQASDVFGPNGLPSRRQQFLSSLERDRERRMHVRWGDVQENDDSESRPFSRSIRTRPRNNTPSLFAPPPENADNAPPNRPRLNGRLGATLPRAELESNRMRQRREQARTSNMDEPLHRSFFRRARSRNGLRTFGDFIVCSVSVVGRDSLQLMISILHSVMRTSTRPTRISSLWRLPWGM
jgi:hypothetical protein